MKKTAKDQNHKKMKKLNKKQFDSDKKKKEEIKLENIKSPIDQNIV